ncbi:hypothetical protein GCM10027404_32650 [Arthrobacter tumbae]|uniref:hypothetical protein n=1 Tax=Arthrobacter tumbae TaxID=163874 RepID=UPI0019591E0A|nr:hypothetical protein [Arthrobacter tumbae]MBM7781245.1 hypothetical protein [Arthrobacter tumbae]
MKRNLYRLRVGYSPNGAFVHDYDRVGDYPKLEAAQEAVGPGLHWYWLEERNVWRTDLGYEEAAEIEKLLGVVRSMAVTVTSM